MALYVNVGAWMCECEYRCVRVDVCVRVSALNASMRVCIFAIVYA